MKKYAYEEQLGTAAYTNTSDYSPALMVINIEESEDESGNLILTTNKTFEEIQSHIQNKGNAIVSNGTFYLPMTYFETDYQIVFSQISTNQSAFYAIITPDILEKSIIINSNNEIYYDETYKSIAFTYLDNVIFEDEPDTVFNISSAINHLKNIKAEKTELDTLKSNVNSIKQLPAYSTSNEGQFLRIVNGIPAWTTVPNAEEASF